ncbi:MAG TPA: glycosyltransferase family 9 protein [Gemmatimonadaceae bacterium]|nr:glycosyltransferase family 9 protein [Gemmatimonadaceae bacterium]
MRSIAVIEPWNIGDIVLSIPFLRTLRRNWPTAKIILVARPIAAEVLAGTGLVDELVAVNLDWTGSASSVLAAFTRLRKTIEASRKLRHQHIDLAFANRHHLREYALLLFSGAHRTVGYRVAELEPPLTDPIVVADPNRSKTDDWLGLLEGLGVAHDDEPSRLIVSESERAEAERFLTSLGVRSDERLVGLHPGASLPEKRWPISAFARVIEAIATEAAVKPLVFIDPDGYGEELANIPGTISAKVGLRQLIALLAKCDLLVCNDSGPMHLAAAVGTPTVALFGAGIDRWYAPSGTGHVILSPEGSGSASGATATAGQTIRSPAGIPVERVIEAVQTLLAPNTGPVR